MVILILILSLLVGSLYLASYLTGLRLGARVLPNEESTSGNTNDESENTTSKSGTNGSGGSGTNGSDGSG